MKQLPPFLFLCFLLSGPYPCPLAAQGARDMDTVSYSRHFITQTGDWAVLFSGRIDPPFPRGMQSMYLRQKGFVERDSFGDEIFPKPIPTLETFGEGSLVYDGIYYQGVRIRLDLVRDAVSVLSPVKNIAMRLEKSRFGSADFHGYHLILLDESANIPAGYYLELYGGEHSVLKKETYVFDEMLYKFTNRYVYWYIRVDGKYQRVNRSKASILKVLQKRRRELSRFMRDSGIDVRTNMDDALVLLVKQYEKLEKQ